MISSQFHQCCSEINLVFQADSQKKMSDEKRRPTLRAGKSDSRISKIVCLNVGGVLFYTTKSTLENEANTFFKALLSSSWADMGEEDSPPSYFIDRDPTRFRYILNWMRGVDHLPDEENILLELEYEADFYCLQSLKSRITQRLVRNDSFSLKRSLEKIAFELGTN